MPWLDVSEQEALNRFRGGKWPASCRTVSHRAADHRGAASRHRRRAYSVVSGQRSAAARGLSIPASPVEAVLASKITLDARIHVGAPRGLTRGPHGRLNLVGGPFEVVQPDRALRSGLAGSKVPVVQREPFPVESAARPRRQARRSELIQ